MTKRQDSHPSAPSPGARPREAPGRNQEWSRRAEQSLAELERLAREILRSAQRVAPEASVDAIQVPLLLSLAAAGGGARGADLVRRIRTELEESLLAAAAFQRGRLYCLRCENSLCEHALPPGPRHVFRGYGQTGRAEWIPFDQFLVARNDPRLNALYGERRSLVSVAVDRATVYQRLLPGFEEPMRRFLILAQLCVGLFVPEGRGEPVALTVQVVRTVQGQGTVLGVNVVGLPGAVPEEAALPRLADALRPLRREAEAMSRRLRRQAQVLEGVALERLSRQCLNLVRDACRDLEHRSRMEGKRTHHARQRSQQGNRPTSKAFEDARKAADEALLEDRETRTVVVLGPRGRVHFFGRDGKHVSSVVYEGSVIRQRTSRKRWTPLSAEAISGFRAGLSDEEPVA